MEPLIDTNIFFMLFVVAFYRPSASSALLKAVPDPIKLFLATIEAMLKFQPIRAPT